MKKIVSILLVVLVMTISFSFQLTEAQAAHHHRRATGKNHTLTFKKGDTVVGAIIKINGKVYFNCAVKKAPMKGTVKNGVIWPWKRELKGKKIIKNSDILKKVVVHTRKVTGENKTLDFKKGDTVVGSVIKINGKTYTDSVIKNAPMVGTVTSGVIWPWDSEIKDKPIIKNEDILTT